MKQRRTSQFALYGLITLLVIVGAKFIAVDATAAPNPRLVVHEWGTFTSVAGEDGSALEWRPLLGEADDLPAFVYRITGRVGDGLRHPLKSNITARIRMETPVLYFYAEREMEVSVKVDFPKGKITEWYPQARSAGGGIDWGRFSILPDRTQLNYPVERGQSHYYPARETDAAPIRVCGDQGQQYEKFLFYRGVGTFNLPLSVKLAKDQVIVKNHGENGVAQVILFENRGGKLGYRIHDLTKSEITLDRFSLDQSLAALERDMIALLTSHNLYAREAAAMVKTWRSSWFEEGLRVFYVLPRQTTDTILPITIEPHPAELTRVLVARTEIITPEMEKTLRSQIMKLADPSSDVRESARTTIRKYGRFAEPILKRVLEHTNDAVTKAQIEKFIKVAKASHGLTAGRGN